MKKTILAAVLLAGTALATSASAAEFTLSADLNLPASGTFGSITGVFNPVTGNANMTVNMNPNFVIDTGSHFALTLSLLGAGRIVESSFNLVGGVDVFTAQPHLAVAGYSNSPFGEFTDAVVGACGSGASGLLCGSVMTFTISNFAGFGPATNLFDPNGGNPPPPTQVFAAVDIFQPSPFCTTEACTGAVGLGVTPTITQVPGPLAGAGIPGLLTACFGMFGLNRWRRRRQAA